MSLYYYAKRAWFRPGDKFNCKNFSRNPLRRGTPPVVTERAGPPPFGDNIFTSQTTPQTIDNHPQDVLDAVMLPTAAKPKAEAAPAK